MEINRVHHDRRVQPVDFARLSGASELDAFGRSAAKRMDDIDKTAKVELK
ncbi:MAG: hypothetical protein ACXW2I_12005 [Burkholderiales bacterium]